MVSRKAPSTAGGGVGVGGGGGFLLAAHAASALAGSVHVKSKLISRSCCKTARYKHSQTVVLSGGALGKDYPGSLPFSPFYAMAVKHCLLQRWALELNVG